MRLPYTLWRSICGEMLKLLALTAAVLVTLIAFAGAVKPLSDGTLRSVDALRYILLAIPPMLAYALPFAGGFAATLTYHRMAADLEAVAAHAGGVSHRALLAPALLVGVLSAGTLVVMNEEIIPRFLKQMQVMVTADVARLLAQQIEKGQAVDVGGMQVLADRVRRIEPDPASGAIDQLLMTGFAAVSVKDGRPVTEATAAVAKMWVLPADDTEGEGEQRAGSRVIVRLEDVVGVTEGHIGATGGRLDFAFRGPDLFRDNVKFLSWRELRGLREHPTRLNWVAARHRTLAGLLAARRATEAMVASAAKDGVVRLSDDRGQRVEVRCARLDQEGPRWAMVPPAGQAAVEVRITRESGPPSVLGAGRALLVAEEGAAAGPRFRLELERVMTRDARGAAEAERALMTMDGLAAESGAMEPLLAMHPRELMAEAAAYGQGPAADTEVRDAVRGVRQVLSRLDHDILSKRNERMALAAACMVTVLIGAVTALSLTRTLPLRVYALTFLPTLGAFVTISGGQQVTTKQGAPGLFLMWGGVGVLAAVAVVLYARLRRH